MLFFLQPMINTNTDKHNTNTIIHTHFLNETFTLLQAVHVGISLFNRANNLIEMFIKFPILLR